MAKGRHVPIRMCAGCRKRRPKAELIRLVLRDDGRTAVDEEKILPGRGVYICPCSGCLELAVKKKGLTRGFRGRFQQIVPEEVSAFFRRKENGKNKGPRCGSGSGDGGG